MRILVQPLSTELASQLAAASSAEIAFDAVPVTVKALGPRRILLLGGGLDTDPLVEIADSLGWRVVVADWKPVNLERLDAGGRCEVIDNSAAGFADLMVGGSFDAAIVKNHNLVRDREHLELLASTDVPYIGLLGPPHRRDRILSQSDGLAEKLGDRLHGPVGARIGGRGPAAVALEIAAELQAFFTDA